jgi:hypothetical protein
MADLNESSQLQSSLNYNSQHSHWALGILLIQKIARQNSYLSFNNIITKSYTVHDSIETSSTCLLLLHSTLKLTNSNYLAQPEVASSYSGGNSTNPSLPLFSTLVPCTNVESECRMIVGSLLNPGLAPYISLSSEWIE